MKDAAPSEREWTQIIRGEFLEIPGLRLTSDQIQKLWGLQRDGCATVLENLLHQRFLQLTADGYYVRAGSSTGVRQSSAKTRDVMGTRSASGDGVSRRDENQMIKRIGSGLVVIMLLAGWQGSQPAGAAQQPAATAKKPAAFSAEEIDR